MTIPCRLLLAAVIICLYAEFAEGDCPQNYVDIEGHCFLFFNDINVNYLDARDVCENNQGDLAVLDECNVFGSVVHHIYNNGLGVANGYWIGARDAITEGDWQWITGDRVEMGSPFWGRLDAGGNEPQGGTGENCAAMSAKDRYLFRDIACDYLKSPLCQRPQISGECPSPYVEIRNECFNFLVTLAETWDNARLICQTSGGDLAIVNDCNLMKDIITYINDNGLSPFEDYWIGGRDIEVEDTWEWINGSPMAMGVPFWGRAGTGEYQPDDGEGEVGEDCAYLWSFDRYYFNDNSCSARLSPLCQAPYVP